MGQLVKLSIEELATINAALNVYILDRKRQGHIARDESKIEIANYFYKQKHDAEDLCKRLSDEITTEAWSK